MTKGQRLAIAPSYMFL